MDSCLNCIKQAQYSIRIGKRPLLIHLIKMTDSLFLWIGSPMNTKLTNLSLSVDNSFSTPSTSVLLSSIFSILFNYLIEIDNNDISERLSRIIAKKFNKLVYVSCGLHFSEEEEEILRSTLVDQLSQLL